MYKKMHNVFLSRIVFMCIFALTHHLPTISASASDLSSSTISSSSLLSSQALPSSSATASRAEIAWVDIATTKSSGAFIKTTDLFAIENDVAAKEISIAAASSSSSSTALYAKPVVTSSLLFQPLKHQEKLTLRRQTRSLFYSDPYKKFYTVCCAYNNRNFSYSFAFYPIFYKFWGIYNPYYGYPRVVHG